MIKRSRTCVCVCEWYGRPYPGVNALSVTGHLHRLRLTPDRPGGLEGDVDGVVADVAALLAGRYSRALTAAASAAAGVRPPFIHTLVHRT